jgi:anti-sigma factor ChrR (cupin superfamily)
MPAVLDACQETRMETTDRNALKPDQTRVVDVRNMPWKEIAPGVKLKVLWRDEASGASTVLFSFAPGTRAPMHEHMGVEQTFVIEGSFEDHDSVITAGNFAVREAGSVHQGFTREGSLHLAIFSRPNRLVESDERIQF